MSELDERIACVFEAIRKKHGQSCVEQCIQDLENKYLKEFEENPYKARLKNILTKKLEPEELTLANIISFIKRTDYVNDLIYSFFSQEILDKCYEDNIFEEYLTSTVKEVICTKLANLTANLTFDQVLNKVVSETLPDDLIKWDDNDTIYNDTTYNFFEQMLGALGIDGSCISYEIDQTYSKCSKHF